MGSSGLRSAPCPGTGRPFSPTDKATLLACVIAAELPDLDSLWQAGDPVMNALMAHRGLSHSLVAAPAVALAATLTAALLLRGARLKPVYLLSLASVLFAHLVPDLWTGWGTRVMLPFSDHRFTWDWTMVVDPLVTLPLLLGGLWALVRPGQWRRAFLAGLAVAVTYVLLRGAVSSTLTARTANAYPGAEQVRVFPALLSVRTWRYVAVMPAEYAVGEVSLFGERTEFRRIARPSPDLLPEAIRTVPTVQEALAWARFPLVAVSPAADGTEVRITDLRYHLRGEPTLQFVLKLDPDLAVRNGRLERGGTAQEFLQRYRER